MKKIFYLISHAFIAIIIAGGFACVCSIVEKYYALSSLQELNAQTVNVIYSVFPVF